MVTIDQKVNILYKKDLNIANTDSNGAKSYYNESIKSYKPILNKSIWSESDKIPNIPPTILNLDNNINGVIKYNEGQLIKIPNNINNYSFYHPSLQNIIQQENYQCYLFESNNQTEILFSEGNWIIDSGSGTLTFYSEPPIDIINGNSPYLHWYQYIGQLGILNNNNIDTIGYPLPLNKIISKYSFDTKLNDSINFGFDNIGSNHGTVYGLILKLSLLEPINNSADFYISDTNNQNYVNINNSFNVSIDSSFAISFWFQLKNNINNLNSLIYWDQAYSISINDQNQIIASCQSNTTIYGNWQSVRIIELNKWYHLVYQRQENTGKYELYINGELDLFDNSDNGLHEINSTSSLLIGFDNTNYSNCYFDEILFMNYQLTKFEIDGIYQNYKYYNHHYSLPKSFQVTDQMFQDVVYQIYPLLSSLEIKFSNIVMNSAYKSNNNMTLVDNVTNKLNLLQSDIIGPFINGSSGILELKLNNNLINSVQFNNEDNSGIYGLSLIINQKKQLLNWSTVDTMIDISTIIQPNIEQQSIQLIHTETGTIEFNINVDDNLPVSIDTNPSIELENINNWAYISGIKTPNINSNIIIHYTPINCVTKFYNKDWICQCYSSLNYINTSYINNPTITIPNSNTPIDHICQINNNIYTDNLNVSIIVQNSTNEQFNINNISHLTKYIRVDTNSLNMNENTLRVKSGNGLYPIIYGSIYDITESLISNYELQFINGYFQYPPSIDYNIYQYENEPNYTNLPNDNDYRWVTFQYLDGCIECCTIQLDIDYLENILLNIKVINKGETTDITGWLNGNSPYDGTTNPSIDGDSCLLLSNSTTNTIQLTFGSISRSGTLLVRIGIKFDSLVKIPHMIVLSKIN